MASIARSVWLAGCIGALLVAGCGDDQMERGIPDHVDTSTPVDPDALSMTEAERQAKQVAEEAEREKKKFDDAHQAAPDAPPEGD